MELNINEELKTLAKNSTVGEVVPFACSIIGSNVSETFNERHISVVNQILTKKRTRLSNGTLEKLSVLRMNRDFMRKMKKSFPNLALRLANVYSPK